MKKILLLFLTGLIGIIAITSLLFYFGVIGNVYDATVTKKHMDIERDNFKHSKSYVEGMVSDLSNYKRDYDRSKSLDEKQQILNFVDDEYSNFDIEIIESNSLREFLLKARGE